MRCRRALLALALAAGGATSARAQEPASPAGEPKGEAPEREEVAAEVEAVASPIFQSGNASMRAGSPLRVDLRYFGVEANDLGLVGASWELRVGGLRLLPGAAWAFGRQNRPAPVLTVRWAFESERFVSQGAWVQSLRAYVPAPGAEAEAGAEPEAVVRHAGILDGLHVSARLERLDLGPMVEHIRYREENAWKGGVRAAWRVAPGLRIVGQVVGPGVEVRGGLAWER